MMNTLKNQEMNIMELEQRFNFPKLEFNQKQKKPQIPQKKNESYNYATQIENRIIGILNNQFFF